MIMVLMQRIAAIGTKPESKQQASYRGIIDEMRKKKKKQLFFITASFTYYIYGKAFLCKKR